MARILIADLPLVETLTPEEQEEILGAGRFEFKPAFEALEAREMMDAGLGQPLLPSFVASQNPAAQAFHGQTQSPGTLDTQGQPVHVEARQLGAAPEALAPQGLASRDMRADGQKIFDEVKSRFEKDMIAKWGISWNIWGLQDVKGNSDYKIEGTTIKVHLRVGYGMYNDQSDKHKVMDVYYTFTAQGERDGATVYRLTNASHDNYGGWFGDGLDNQGKRVMGGDFLGAK
jgi:hypothetical protein